MVALCAAIRLLGVMAGCCRRRREIRRGQQGEGDRERGDDCHAAACLQAEAAEGDFKGVVRHGRSFRSGAAIRAAHGERMRPPEACSLRRPHFTAPAPIRAPNHRNGRVECVIFGGHTPENASRHAPLSGLDPPSGARRGLGNSKASYGLAAHLRRGARGDRLRFLAGREHPEPAVRRRQVGASAVDEITFIGQRDGGKCGRPVT